MRVILYLLAAVRLCIAVDEGASSVMFTKAVKSVSNCTVYRRSFQKVLNRNKRWFVFPNGGNLLLTIVVTKTILDGRPRGLQESMEVEMGFSVPSGVEGWRPEVITRLKNKSVISAVNTTSMNIKQKNAQPKIDSVNNNLGYRKWNNYTYNRWIQRNRLRDNRYSATNRRLFYKRNRKPLIRPWHYHREYRERREIFQKFEVLGKYLGINFKACIMRAICEVKNSLLPEGESFIQDVARIIFTIPIDHEFEDDYINIARDEQTNCARKFSVTCPFSPVEYFLQMRIRSPLN